ncbi:DUF7351 domain-containing protein [Natronobiforma cellulositropha]|uniref:DUF7351 domain-containing protein n=1 Tax=Natronobiforma cellulositropha TaxID=1679076 RepID=UPI0021D5AE78|nr:ArsR family transcriptional regulator [Natronobiforma cellulositropha]
MTPTDEIDDAVVDAIGALGNAYRLEVLLALAERGRELEVDGHAMTFTELYEAVDIDSSSQFAYHLERLVGQFVAETEAGYRLTYAGDRIVRVLRSGVYESAPAFEGRALKGVCLGCGSASLVATLADERFVVRCEACETPVLSDYFPRSQTRERSPEAVVESAATRIWSSSVLLRGGVCPACYGRVDTTADRHDHAGQTRYTHRNTCRTCDLQVHLPVEVAAVSHPRAVGFLWDHGVSLFDLPLWELLGLLSTGALSTTPHSSEPLEVRVDLSFAGETLSVLVDGSGAATPLEE